jgi:hypothetical protein
MKQHLDPIEPEGLRPGYEGLVSFPHFQAETTLPEPYKKKGPEALLARLRSSLLDARVEDNTVEICRIERMIDLLCRRHGLS